LCNAFAIRKAEGRKQKAEVKAAFRLCLLPFASEVVRAWDVECAGRYGRLSVLALIALSALIALLDVRRLLGRFVVLHEVGRHIDCFFLGIVQVVHSTAELCRDRAARTILVLLERGLLLSLGRGRRAEVAIAVRLSWAVASARSPESAAKPRAAGVWTRTATATAATRTAESAGTRPAVSARWAWGTSRPAVFSRARFADGERPAHEELTIQLANGLLGGAPVCELDKRKSASATGLAIEWAHDLCWFTDLRKVRTEVVFGCLVRQIPDKQSDWWHG
jgi:hypothetical protein